MTKQEALREINETQDYYVSKYVDDKNGKVRKGFVDHIIKSNNKNISNERLN